MAFNFNATVRKPLHPEAGNIYGVRFADTWPNGRPFKHGAMIIEFIFHPRTREVAEADVESLMSLQGYERGRDYHIPGWNYGKFGSGRNHVNTPYYITFNDDETFVMAKMTWNIENEKSD